MSSDSTDSVLREVFSTIDQDGSSTLEKKELLKALMFNEDIANKLHQFPHLLPLLKPKHFQESFLAMDTSRDNHVSVEEFVAFASGYTLEEAANEIFKIMDNDGRGAVEKDYCITSINENEECKKVINACDRLRPLKALGEEQTKGQFLRLGTVTPGKVNRREFLEFVVGVTNSFDTSVQPVILTSSIATKKAKDAVTEPVKEKPVRDGSSSDPPRQGLSRDKALLALWAQLEASKEIIDAEEARFDLLQANVEVQLEGMKRVLAKYASKGYDGPDAFTNEILGVIREAEHENSIVDAEAKNVSWQIQKLFKEVDHDSKGAINEEKLLRFVTELSLANPILDLPTTKEETKRVMKVLDTDKSGEIDEEEFTVWIKSGLDKTKEDLNRFASKGAFQKKMANFIQCVKSALTKSPEAYLKERIHDLFVQFDGTQSGCFGDKDLSEMLMYLGAFRPELDLPHSTEDITAILGDLGSDGKLHENEFVEWIHEGISQAPMDLLEFGKSSPFNSRMINFLDSVRSWLKEDSKLVQSGKTKGMFGDMARRKVQIKRLYNETVSPNSSGQKFMDQDSLLVLLEEIRLIAPKLELPAEDEIRKVLQKLDTNRDGKVDINDFLEYMIASLTRSENRRAKYAAVSKFNQRMENMVTGLIAALDNDPIVELHKRVHEFLDRYKTPNSGAVTATKLNKVMRYLSTYLEDGAVFPSGKEDAKRMITLIGGGKGVTDEVSEEAFMGWLDRGFTGSAAQREKLRQKSSFHAKAVAFIEMMLAYVKNASSLEAGVTEEFTKGQMGITINEIVDDDGNTHLLLADYAEDSPAARNDQIEHGMTVIEVDGNRLVNAGFGKLKEIIQSNDKNKVRITFRPFVSVDSYHNISKYNSRKKQALRAAKKAGALCIVFKQGPIGLSFDEEQDKEAGGLRITLSKIAQGSQASKHPRLAVGQQLYGVGLTPINGQGMQAVINIIREVGYPLELLFKDGGKDAQKRVENRNNRRDQKKREAEMKKVTNPKKAELSKVVVGKNGVERVQVSKEEMKAVQQKKRRPMQVKHMFEEYDINGTGHIGVEELGTLIFEISVINPALELPSSVSDIDTLMKVLDGDNNGSIEQNEFVDWICKGLEMNAAQRVRFSRGSDFRVRLNNFLTGIELTLSQQPAEVMRKRMHTLFDHFDSDQSGSIDMDELHDMIQELSLMNPHAELPTTEEDLEHLMHTLTKNDKDYILETDIVNWLYDGVATSPEARKSFSRESHFNHRLVNMLESLVAWLKAPPELTERLLPESGTRPKRRAKLRKSVNTKPSGRNENGSKMTVEQLRAQREQNEFEEISRLRERARNKQKARLSAIRKAESDIVSKQYEKMTRGKKHQSEKKARSKRSEDEKKRMDRIRKKHSDHQRSRKAEIDKKNTEKAVAITRKVEGTPQKHGLQQGQLPPQPGSVQQGSVQAQPNQQIGYGQVPYQMNPYQQLQVPYQGAQAGPYQAVPQNMYQQGVMPQNMYQQGAMPQNMPYQQGMYPQQQQNFPPQQFYPSQQNLYNVPAPGQPSPQQQSPLVRRVKQ